MKFQQGLNPHIQDYVTCLTSCRPSKEDLKSWYATAILCNENHIANKVFKASLPLAPHIETTPLNRGLFYRPPIRETNPPPITSQTATASSCFAPPIAFKPQPSQHCHCPEHHRHCDDSLLLMQPTQTQSKRLPETIQYPLHGHQRTVKFRSGQVRSPRHHRSGGKIVTCSGRRGDTGFWQGQQVLGVPPLSVHNHFTELPVDELTEIDSVPTTAINETKAIPPTSPRHLQLP